MKKLSILDNKIEKGNEFLEDIIEKGV